MAAKLQAVEVEELVATKPAEYPEWLLVNEDGQLPLLARSKHNIVALTFTVSRPSPQEIKAAMPLFHEQFGERGRDQIHYEKALEKEAKKTMDNFLQKRLFSLKLYVLLHLL
jgi:hypothetical protein